MRSLSRRFKSISEKNPFWSSLVCFNESVCGQRFNKELVINLFNKLVDKDDYDKKDKKEVMEFALTINKSAEEGVCGGILSTQVRFFSKDDDLCVRTPSEA